MSYFTQNHLLAAIILGSITTTTAGFPAVVVAQAPVDVDTEIATSTDSNDVNEETVAETEVTSTLQEAVTTSVEDQAIPTDNYRREQLPSNEVFGDFVVGPGRIEVELAPGESRTVELIVSNRIGDDKIFSFDIEDTTGSKTGDGAVLLLGDAEGPYSLRDYISIPHENFLLEHGTRARIPVTISLPPDAEPGGRYGSVLSTVTSRPGEEENLSGTQPAAAVISRVGTLFFVTTPGDINRESNVQSFTTRNNKKLYSSGPVAFDIVMENTGTVHTSPSATLRITNLLGEEVGLVEIEPWFIFPESLRNREITWDREVLFGRYVATVDVSLGHGDIVETRSFAFWVIPLKFVLAVFFGFLALFLFFRFVFSRFEFKRKQ